MNPENYYREMRAIYDDPHSLMSRKLRLVAGIVRPGAALLDVGCGTGAFIAAVAERFAAVTGIDEDERAVALCRDRFVGLHHVSLHHCPAEQVASLAGPFDTISCLDVIEHLDDPGPVLDAVNRLLRPGGQMIMTVPNWYSGVTSFFHDDGLHKQFHSSWGWAALLRRHGFGIRRIRSVAFPLVPSEFLAKHAHLFGMCVVIEAAREDHSHA